MDNITKLNELINKSNNIVFFGGAGISTLSGIKDFKGENGIYKKKYKFAPEYYLSSNCFYNNPYVFYDFYKKEMNSLNALPNIVHKYLYNLEKSGKLKAVITQNIDGLHQKAGNKNVYEIHGSIYRNYCTKCNKFYNAEYVFNSESIPTCTCGGIIKPDVVLYGESLPNEYILAINKIKECDLLIVAGTSLTVEPAASMINFYKGDKLVIINKDKTPYDDKANILINEDMSKIFTHLTKY